MAWQGVEVVYSGDMRHIVGCARISVFGKLPLVVSDALVLWPRIIRGVVIHYCHVHWRIQHHHRR